MKKDIASSATRPEITPKSLLSDNHSKEAKESIAFWNEMHDRNLLHTVWTCSDARCIIPDPKRASNIRTISASGSSRPYEELLEDPAAHTISLIIHHDGDLTKKGQPLQGCGGLAARRELETNTSHEKLEGVLHFVEENVNHPDPIVQAGIRASAIAHRSHKPVLAATQDHLTGEIIPFGIYRFKDGVTHVTTAVLPHYSYQNVYKASELYKHGIPRLADKQLEEFGPEFLQLLEVHRQQLEEIQDRYPNLREKQKVQQPGAVFITTMRRPKEIRFPSLFSEPGSCFKVQIPLKTDIIKGKSVVRVRAEDWEDSINQVEYPILHAVENYGDDSKPFSTVHRLLIETISMDDSKELARQIVEKKWMQEWLEKDQRNKIIVMESAGGVVQQVQWFD